MKSSSRFIRLTISLTAIFYVFLVLCAMHWKKGPDEPELDILHYTLFLDITDIKGKQIKGHADLQILSNTQSLSEINLDLLDLIVDSVWIDEVPVSQFLYDGRIIKIPLDETLQKNQSMLVSVFYHGSPVSDPNWGGFYFKDPYAYNMGVGMGSDPHPFGRCWYPCQDSFIDRASYDYFITVAKENTAVCPGELVEVIDNDNGSQTYYWTMKQSIPTYLSCVAVAPYISISDTLRGERSDIPTMVYVTQDDSVRAVKAFMNMGQWLVAFEKLFGSYKWNKIGFAAVPFRGGAMEHATAVSFAQSTLNYGRNYEDLYVHEFAHSWFGNLVTCATASDMWLNEGWASYSEALFHEFREGKERFKTEVRKNHRHVLQDVFYQDGNIPIYPVPSEKTYSSTVYNKGFDAAHGLRGQLGDPAFFKALKDYFRTYAFQSISTEEFMHFLENSAEVSLEDHFNFWIKDKGFPHFSVDTFYTEKLNERYKTQINIKQRIWGATGYSYRTKIDLLFIDQHWRQYNQSLVVSGPLTSETVVLPFKPEHVLIDPEEKIPDATIDEYQVIKNAGFHLFRYPYFGLKANSIQDSILVRATRNYICVDTARTNAMNFEMDYTGFWTLEGNFNSENNYEVSFFCDSLSYSGNRFFRRVKEQGQGHKLILLYRKSSNGPWIEIPFVYHGTDQIGFVSSSFVQQGVYCLALPK